MEPALSIFPLGDSAITIDLGDHIDEELNNKALAIRDWLAARRFTGVQDIIVAYSSVSVFYDPVQVRAAGRVAGEEAGTEGGKACTGVVFGQMKEWLEQAWRQAIPPADTGAPGREGQEGAENVIVVPVCYGGRFGPDLETVSSAKEISPEEVIQLHGSRIYRVYMVGFLPGFAYLGKIDERLEMTRKATPVPVLAGSVGIVGSQSGIYPLNSPGGWHIIGLTPLKLFDPQAEIPVLLKAGDYVQFRPVSPAEFDDLSGRE